MLSLGVDLGGTKIACGIINETGQLIQKKSIETLSGRGHEAVFKDIAELCQNLIKENGYTIQDFSSIGIGLPGVVNPEKKELIFAANLNFRDLNIESEIKKHIDLPIFIENDANCAAFGEYFAGASKNFENSVTITLGTGVGCGIIINKKIYSGGFFGAGEIGHHVIIVGGEQCNCGRKGCFETYASATALIRETKEAAKKCKESLIWHICGGDIEKITAKTCFDAKDMGDETASKVIDNYLFYLTEGLLNITHILQPEIIVLGGGIAAQGEKILTPIRKMMTKHIYSGILETKIVSAELGNDAGIVGAAMLYAQQ